jgi:hypothetical protein
MPLSESIAAESARINKALAVLPMVSLGVSEKF